MKRILILMSLAALTLAGCAEAYDDTEIKDMIEALEGRTAALEDLCARVNTGIVLVNRLEEAKQLNQKVTSVVAESDGNGKVLRYTVSLTDGSTLTIECPSDGADGYVGKDGEDAQAPVVGIAQHEGQDCWTIGGEFVTDTDGSPIPVYSYAGGEKTDGRTPELKVEEGKWSYRFPGETEWTPIAVAIVYGNGNLFSSVQEDGDKVVFNLSAGGSITIPVSKPFSIAFDTLSGTVKAGGSLSLTYRLVSEDDSAEVEVFAPVGWNASAADGTLTVEVPSDAVAGTVGMVVVFAAASNGESVYQVINITVEEAE